MIFEPQVRTFTRLTFWAVVASLAAGCSTTEQPTATSYRLSVPPAEVERAYLGLSGEASNFQLEEIRCEVLVVDCFDMYCHVCQVGAKRVNELYQLVQQRGLGERVKVIGLGVGDTPLEVATYKQKFKVPFPVFPDRRAVIAKSLGQLKLPSLIVLRKEAERFKVIHTSSGELRDPAELLSRLQAALAAGSHSWTDPVLGVQPTCDEQSTACRNTVPSRGAAFGSARN